MIDIVCNHQFALINRKDKWELVETFEHKRRERSHLQLADIVESSDDAIISVTLEGMIFRWNPAAEKIYGYSGEEIMGSSLSILIPSDSSDGGVGILDKVRNRKTTCNFETIHVKKDGGRICVSLTVLSIESSSGNIVGASIIAEDITDRKRALEEMRETKDYLESLFDYANAPIIVWNTEFEITRFNHAFERLTGLRAEDVLCKSLELLFPGDRREESMEHIHHTTAGERWEVVEIPIVHVNGSVRTVLWNSANIYAEDGVTFLATIAQGQDITERKKAEETIKQSQERLLSIFNSMTDYCYIVSRDYKIGFMNKSMRGKFGEQTGNVCYKSLFGRESPCPWTKMMNVQEGKTVRWEHSSPDLGSTFEVIDSPLINKDGTISKLSIWRDISERKQAEKKIKASLKEKEVLLKEIHHRVKNNLQLVYSLLNLQSPYLRDKQAIDIFTESKNRIKSIALLHETLYGSEDLARIDFVRYTHSLVDNLSRSHGASAHTILKIDIHDILLGIDVAIPCGLIINELVSNSLKYAFLDSKEGLVYINLYLTEENSFELIVGDNGIGFPKNVDFRNTQTLGLQLVCTLTEQLGGKIELYRDKGTEFRITFAG